MLAEAQLDPVGLQGLGQRLAERLGLARQQAVGPLDDHRLAAEAHHRLGHLHPHRAAAEDEQPPRDLRQARDLAVRPHAVQVASPSIGGMKG